MPPHQLLDIFIGGIVVFLDVWRVHFLYGSLPAQFERTLQIIVTVPVLLDLLLCHSRAWLPREESRSFPTSSSGIRDSSRAPDTRAGMTEKFHRAAVRVTILCRNKKPGATPSGLRAAFPDPSPCPGRGQARLARAGEGSIHAAAYLDSGCTENCVSHLRNQV